MTHEIDAYDYRRYAILFVDDEPNTRKYFKRLFGEKFRIIEAEDGVQALEVFNQNAAGIGIIVTDQRMPNETGVGFLSKIADDHQDIIKILSTAYSDIDAAIGSVNQGGIFRYMTKPWDIPQMEVTLRRAMEFFVIRRERDALLAGNVREIGKVLLAGRLAAFALVPVCKGLSCARAAEAVAAFVQIGVAGRQAGPERDAGSGSVDWARQHANQVSLAGELEKMLPAALKKANLAARVDSLKTALDSAGAAGIALESTDDGFRLTAAADPLPGLLEVLFGRNDEPQLVGNAVEVLGAFMAVHDAGGTLQRISGVVLTLSITQTSLEGASTPGEETAKWIFDNDRLISAALGLP